MSEEDLTKLLVRVDIPELKTQKCVVLSVKDTVWAAKQVVLDKLSQDLPNNLLNYGLYLLPSVPGKLGKYMDDGRFLGDYVLHGHVPRIELRYKKRDYSIQVTLKGKDISKANTKANLKKFVDNIVQGNVKKVEKMLDFGVDPNFITEEGNTPLGVACGRNANVQVIMPLLSNGAHIDFRGKEGLTPLHRAALGGNSAAIKILLSYGASPNYRDVKGLTPVYHTAIMGDDTACCESLLCYRAELGIRDHAGWTELHQVAKYGHVKHADLLIKYGAGIHAQNNAGNTPLHVAVSHGQESLAMLLLKRGSDRTKLNFSNQLPSQVAILCGHHSLSAEIANFTSNQIELIKGEPDYHPGARHFDKNLFDMDKMRAEVGPTALPPDTIIGSLAQEWNDKEACVGGGGVPTREEPGDDGGRGRAGSDTMFSSRSGHGSSVSIPSITAGMGPQHHLSIETADSESLSSYDRDSIHSTSTAGGTPGPNTPQSHHRRQQQQQQPTFATQRERLYRGGPGRYVALEDVAPLQSDDLPLRRGMEVEVVYIGKGGYWEGRAGGRQGWFPARAIQEMTDDGDSGVFSEYSKGNQPTTMTALSDHQLLPPPPPMQSADSWQGGGDGGDGGGRGGEGGYERSGTATNFGSGANFTNQPIYQPSTAPPEGVREVFMQCGPKGYGFAMRGVKATKAMKFTPTPQVPALQYIGSVEKGSSADLAGLKTGDFLLEINYHNVTYYTHDDVVGIIRQAGKTLHMKVITPSLDSTLRTSVQLQKQVEIMSSSNSLNHQSSNESEVRRGISFKGTFSSSSSFDPSPGSIPHRETVIDDVSLSTQQQQRQPSRGGESPNLERLNQSGWDSSQDEGNNAPGTPGRMQKFSYLHPPTSSALSSSSSPLTRQYSPTKKQKAFVPPPTYQGSSSTSLSSMSESSQAAPENISTFMANKYTTLPPAQKPIPASLHTSSSDDNEEDEEEEERGESAFTKALKLGKEKLTNSPAIRKRSSTMPSSMRNRAPQFGVHSHDKSPAESPHTVAEKPHPFATSTFKQPLAAALMRKIDSVRIDNDENDNWSDEDDSFTKTPPARSRSHTSEKAPPPPATKPKPKPLMKRAHTTVDPRHLDDPQNDAAPISPLKQQPLRGKSVDIQAEKEGKEKSVREDDEDDEEGGGSGRMNWKSVLKPVKRTGSGRASPAPEARSPFSSASSSNHQSPLKSPQHTSIESSTTTNNLASYEMEYNNLPPPLPQDAIGNRLSVDFLNLPPPADFMLVSGVETGETSTDITGNSPALSHRSSRPSSSRTGRSSPSPPPPPPPDSSPPRENFNRSPLAGVRIPPLTKQPPLPVQYEDDSFKVPSPIPSPLNTGSFDDHSTTDPGAILPPSQFITSSEGNRESGFSIPTPPGFEIPTPPSEGTVATTGVVAADGGDLNKSDTPSDLNEAIRQLQMLSDDLSVTALAPAPARNVSPQSNKSREEVKIKTESHHGVSPSKLTDTPSPIPPPASHSSRSSTSSSIVSSLAREYEVEQVDSSKTPLQAATSQPPPPPAAAPTLTSVVTKSLAEWEVDEVCMWLEDIGLGEHCPQFRENEILGEHLLELTKDELAELGVKKIGHKKTFLTKVKELAPTS